jgi:hypothetical protein
MALSVSKSRLCSRCTNSSVEQRVSPAERVTVPIAALLERGVRPWVKPWRSVAPDALAFPQPPGGAVDGAQRGGCGGLGGRGRILAPHHRGQGLAPAVQAGTVCSVTVSRCPRGKV